MDEKLIEDKVLKFLYNQVQAKKIPHIRPGMVEDFVGFINGILMEQQAQKTAERVAAQQAKMNTKEEVNEKDS